MSDKWNDYAVFLNGAIESCRKKEAELIADERKDEANLCRVQENIYGIFQSFLSVSERVSCDDRTGFVKQKAALVMAAWQQSYEKAKEFNDVEKMLIEETKLKAAQHALGGLPEGEAS